MLNRLLTISKRRRSEYTQSPSSPARSISTFHNPARKKYSPTETGARR